jgi:uncharacterized damage-inducible protein DinB
MTGLLADVRHEYRRHKDLADRAMSALDDEMFVRRPADSVNSIALIVKHVAGNLQSRWTDFLTTDGEKQTRDRDGEFRLTDQDTRAALLAAWERGWRTLFDTLDKLDEADLDRSITIRAEPHTVRQALLRGATHVAYHTGQILYLARLWQPQSPWLTVAPGRSGTVGGAYRESR